MTTAYHLGPGSLKLIEILESRRGDCSMRLPTPNGWGLQVLRVMPPSGDPHGGFDGARQGLYEIALLKRDRLCLDGPLLRDPEGSQSPIQIAMTLREIFELPEAPK